MYVLTNVPQRFADWCAITVYDVVGLGQVTIDALPDDIFLDVFEYFVDPFQSIEGWFCADARVSKMVDRYFWITTLRLYCTARTSIMRMLPDGWPPLRISSGTEAKH
jgi:hypothetical protein